MMMLSITVDHLDRIGRGSKHWKFPPKEDKAPADLIQVLATKPDTEWDYSNASAHKLLLKNDKEIALEVRNIRIE